MKSLLLFPVLFAALTVPSTERPAPAGDHDWVVDTSHSSVVFRVKHAGISNFYGAFDEIRGTVSLDPQAPEKGKVAIEIPVDSVDTRDAKRDEHLKGPDFFNGKENPVIAFTSTKIEKQGEGLAVTGDLELAGKKKSITMMVEKTGEGDFFGPRIGYEAKFTIVRSEFGMNYGVAKNALGDEVALMIGLELVKPKK
jgi:polyisoprenoid-binding protein YceI